MTNNVNARIFCAAFQEQVSLRQSENNVGAITLGTLVAMSLVVRCKANIIGHLLRVGDCFSDTRMASGIHGVCVVI